MEKVLVTGGNGFIGSFVVDNLLERGITPIIFGRQIPQPWKEGARFFLGDTRDFTSVHEAVALSDGVIHLAGVLGTSETINEPRPAVETNIYGGLNIFKACQNYGKKCSYISVGNYWMNNSYSITKDTAERLAWMFNRELGTKIAVSRALNAYGPRQKSEPVRKIMPNFVLPALRDEELIVYGDGSQVMDMIYVADVADVLVRALLVDHGQYIYNPLQGENKAPKFDIGTGRNTTVQQVAEMVIKKVGKGRIKNVPMRKGEPEHSVVLGNPETLAPLYDGNIPKLVQLEEGLDRTIEYYESKLK
jgi:UDP-glucose 4-epimerase